MEKVRVEGMARSTGRKSCEVLGMRMKSLERR